MNNQFDELTKGLAQSAARRSGRKKFAVSLALAVLVSSVPASTLAPLIELSRPNAVGTCDTGFPGPPGNWTLDDTFEPFLAVNPVNPKNIVVAWIQGLLQNIIASVSLDGGRTWQQVPVPFTTCSGGPYLGAGDERLCFAANGDLYAVSVVGMDLPTRGVAVCKSNDGGLHWSGPITLDGPRGYVPDDIAEVVSDPTNPQRLYAVWDGSDNGHRGPAIFTRTTDGGQSWDPPRVIVQTTPQDYVQFSQLLATSNGTLLNVYELVDVQNSGHGIQQAASLQVIRSLDNGLTWSAPTAGPVMTPILRSDGDVLVTDPDTGALVNGSISQSVAMDTRNGNIYAVWSDGRFSNFQYGDVALSVSPDGGFSWSTPIRINQTPLNIAGANRQTFVPNVAVASDGTVGVTYYDFRFNDSSPGLPTDYWLVRCQPTLTRPATDPSNWANEIRLTDTPFNLEACGTILNSFYPGDYFGLATIGSDFITAFVQVDADNVTSTFFRRVGK